MATAAQYAATSRAAVAQVTAANTARDGTGTIVTVMAGASTGSRVDDIRIQATGTVTAGVVRLFLSLDNGTTNRLLREILVTATTPSTTVEAWSASLTNLGILLPSTTALLRASTNNAETFNILVTRAGDF
jgi:hypothetical protein